MIAGLSVPAAAQQSNPQQGRRTSKCTPFQEGRALLGEMLGYKNPCSQSANAFNGKDQKNASTIQRGTGAGAAKPSGT